MITTDKVIDYFSWTLLIICILLLRVATRFLENIVHGRAFVWQYFLIGLLIAIIITYGLYRWKPDYYEGGEQRGSAVLSLFFSIILLTIFGNAFYTFYTGKKHQHRTEAIIITKGENPRYGTQYVTVLMNGKKERFNPMQNEYQNMIIGDTVIVTLGRGDTDFEFIYSFNRK